MQGNLNKYFMKVKEEKQKGKRESDEGDATSTLLNREVFFSGTLWIKPMTSSTRCFFFCVTHV